MSDDENPLADMAELTVYGTQSETGRDIIIQMEARFGNYEFMIGENAYSVTVGLRECTVRLRATNCMVSHEGRAGDENQAKTLVVKTTAAQARKSGVDASAHLKGKASVGTTGIGSSIGVEGKAGGGVSQAQTLTEKTAYNDTRRSITALSNNVWSIEELTDDRLKGKYYAEDGFCKIIKTAAVGTVTGVIQALGKDLVINIEKVGPTRLFAREPTKAAVVEAIIARSLRESSNKAIAKITFSRSSLEIAEEGRNG